MAKKKAKSTRKRKEPVEISDKDFLAKMHLEDENTDTALHYNRGYSVVQRQGVIRIFRYHMAGRDEILVDVKSVNLRGARDRLREEKYLVKNIKSTELAKAWDNRPPPQCYITTACVKAASLPEDCEVLQTLRDFRDNHIRNLPNGSRLIQAYYDTAPQIVAAIERKPNSNDLFKRLFDTEIVPTVEMVRQGDYDLALKKYAAIVTELRQEHLN